MSYDACQFLVLKHVTLTLSLDIASNVQESNVNRHATIQSPEHGNKPCGFVMVMLSQLSLQCECSKNSRHIVFLQPLN